MNELTWLDVVIFAPVAGAVVVDLVACSYVTLIRLAVLVVTSLTFSASLLVLLGFDTGAAGFHFETSLEWIS